MRDPNPHSTRPLLSKSFGMADLERREVVRGLVADLDGAARPSDLATIVAEVVANAVRHGRVECLNVRASQRGPVVLVGFHQRPALSAAACAALARAKSGWLPDPLLDRPGGLGLPLLCRLSHRVTVSLDRATLRVWLVTPLPGGRQ
jgi:anti-sigma regulatory factor (Ser/Thr protein kinase)